MSAPLAVLRPEPGNAATAARIAAAGGTALRLPLFAVVPLAWDAPPADDHDALFLTSANAVRHAGPALASYRDLPVHAVGTATAAAARAAGLNVTTVGEADARALAEAAVAAGVSRALHLAGRDRAVADLPGVRTTATVYASEPIEISPADLARLDGAVALLHSPRAAARLAELVGDRSRIALAALSPAVLARAGEGWRATTTADRPDDTALIAAGLALAARLGD